MRKKFLVLLVTSMMIVNMIGCGGNDEVQNTPEVQLETASPAPSSSDESLSESFAWLPLASLTSSQGLREAWDSILGITTSSTSSESESTSKEGCLYESSQNDYLTNLLASESFQSKLKDQSIKSQLVEATLNNCKDLDESASESQILAAGLMAYFELLPESDQDSSATMKRSEFMTLVARANNEADDSIAASADFTAQVGSNKYTRFAELESNNMYLTGKSMNATTFDGTISRAEAIYTLVNQFKSEDLNGFNESNSLVEMNDAIDAGDIETTQGFAGSEDSKAKALSYSLQNADKGLPSDMYKTLAFANFYGIISPETRWDDSITQGETVEIMRALIELDTNAYIESLGAVDETESESSLDNDEAEVMSSAAIVVTPAPTKAPEAPKAKAKPAKVKVKATAKHKAKAKAKVKATKKPAKVKATAKSKVKAKHKVTAKPKVKATAKPKPKATKKTSTSTKKQTASDKAFQKKLEGCDNVTNIDSKECREDAAKMEELYPGLFD